MLLILYGTIAEMGYKSRQYLAQSGFLPIEKYNYAETPLLSTQYGTRNFVSEEEFLKKTDSLFRYKVGGIWIGFNDRQITDAVSGKTNCFLSFSTDRGDKTIIESITQFLVEVKKVYADQVRLICTYIDDATIRNIIGGINGITAEEAKVRYEISRNVKQNYLQYKKSFDHVLIYGGEDSEFDFSSLYRQLDSIIDGILGKSDPGVQYGDVFISYTRNDAGLYQLLRRNLLSQGISVFDDTQLSGSGVRSTLSDAIQNDKIVIPIITDNALSGSWEIHKTTLEIQSAEKSGALIVPVFKEGVDLEQAPEVKLRLETLSCILLDPNDMESSSVRLAEKIKELLTAEANLKALSKQVENYLCLKMYAQAKQAQEAHLALCDDIFVQTRGTFLDLEACLLSRVKLINILLDMGSYEDALEQTVEALNLLDGEDTYDVLVDQFFLCCAYLDLDEDAVRELALERLQVQDCLDKLFTGFVLAQNTVKANRRDEALEEADRSEDEKKIAQYGEMAIALFEELIQDSSKSLSRHDLILGYERILNYCKHMGLKGEVADKCISRIAALNSFAGTTESVENTVAAEALKVYLGQAVPGSGEYDVFLSFKGEDEILARKVYDYLTQSGKEVFFSKATLPELGQSEYEDMIFAAIEHSRHMVLVSSDPDYLKTRWVKKEWSTFDREITEGRKESSNIVLVLMDDIAADKGRIPTQLRGWEIVKMSEFRNRLLTYLR